MSTPFKYFAFISYNSKDTIWGKRLQKKLEHYKLPSTLCSEHGWTRTPIKPVFFAPTDIQPGGLSEELQEGFLCSLLNGAFGTGLQTDAPDAPVLRGDLAETLMSLFSAPAA